jgi:nucleoside-diphosphate-sugar epimerase
VSLHVVVGAGPIGSGTALELAAQGHAVRVVTRSGRAPEHENIEAVAADVAAPGVLAGLCAGAEVLYNCANPRAYQYWAQELPPLNAAMLEAAERSGAVLVLTGNVYGYGPHTGPITEETPLAATGFKGRMRADAWRTAEAAHRAGRIRVVEARSADYFGPRVLESHTGKLLFPRLLAGRPGVVFGNPDLVHARTYAPDVVRTLVRLGAEERAWGRAWHVPGHPAISQREFVAAFCRAASVPAPKLVAVGRRVRRALGLLSARVRELDEIAYQIEEPFEMDSSAVEREFGLRPTPWRESLLATAAWWRMQSAVRRDSRPQAVTRRNAAGASRGR